MAQNFFCPGGIFLFNGRARSSVFALLLFLPEMVGAQSSYDDVVTDVVELDPDPPGFSSQDSEYGAAVALHNDRLVMAGTGTPVIVFEKKNETWQEAQILDLPEGATLPTVGRAMSLATRGEFLLIGNAGATQASSARTGLVYIAEWNGQQYDVIGTITPASQQTSYEFGARLSFSDDHLFIGAPGADGGEGEILVYDVPADLADLSSALPIETLRASIPNSSVFGESFSASPEWLVAKQRQFGSSSVSVLAFSLSPPAFDQPIQINLDELSFRTSGTDLQVRENVVLIRKLDSSRPFDHRGDYLQYRLTPSGAEQLDTLTDSEPSRGFFPVIADAGDQIYFIAGYDDPNFGQVDPEVYSASWTGTSWQMDPGSVPAWNQLLDFDDIAVLGSAVANSDLIAFGNPGIAPGGDEGGGIHLLSRADPSALLQTLDAGRDGSHRSLGYSLVRMDSLLIASAPGWCKVYVMDASTPAYELIQTLSAESPCYFGADLAVSQNTLFVGNPSWYADGSGINGTQVGQVHVFSFVDGQFIEEDALRVNPPTTLRRLGQNLAVDDRLLFVTGEDEVFAFDLDDASSEPFASSPVGPTVGPSRMSLDARQGTLVVAQTGVTGLLTILDQDLVLLDTIQDSSPNFGTSARILSEDRLITNRLGGLAIFDRIGGAWMLTEEIFPAANITGFGFSLDRTEEIAWIGSAAGFVSSEIEGNQIRLDVVVEIAEGNFFQPARSFAASNSKSAVFVGFPSKNVSQSKHDLLLHVDFDVVLKRDGFE